MNHINGSEAMPLHSKLATVFVVGLGMSLLTTVALTNIMVLLLLMTAPWAWAESRRQSHAYEDAKVFFALIVLFCTWDVITNLIAGHGIYESVKDLLHDMRTIGFILVLWPVFANAKVSRIALWAILISVVVLAGANLLLTVIGVVPPGRYFWPTAPHLYGQILVGLFFVLAQIILVRPELAVRAGIPMAILVLSLFFASERRTGYLQLVAGFAVWALINYKRLWVGKYRWVFAGVALTSLLLAFGSDVVSRRMWQIWEELQLFMSQSETERVTKFTSVGIRLQFYISIWDLIVHSNWWVGVGSLSFPDMFFAVNEKFGATDRLAFTNPHNEYLFILATKGLIGLVLYLAIFVQACRMAWAKTDEIQRVGLVVFVFLFLLSITTNSMMIDMEEGHFTMLILLIFLAPQKLSFVTERS